MLERRITQNDVANVGHTCSKHVHQPDGTWLLYGEDEDGDLIRVVCAYDGNTLIVTVMG